jgi:3',5'-nucleoside bisphosphate phosphatase
MLIMKKIYVVLFSCFLISAGFPQKKLLRLPQITGFVTLACDFHEHTIFSDGEVWPTVRLDEAERNGLDVVAFTDHIEYVPHKDYVKPDLNAAWKIVFEEGLKRDLIIVHGAEITRKMPPGHFNALFIQDAEKLKEDDFVKVIQEAIAQGAFIQWNHPGWKAQRPDGIPRMDSIHRALIKNKWLHGIEIYNSIEFYPDVINWCIDNNLAMTGNSDIHDPYGPETVAKGQSHPPTTLVFATSRTEKDLKEALFAQRTLVWFGDTIAGKEELAKEFFLNSLEFGKVYYQDEKNCYRLITNHTDIPFNIAVAVSEKETSPRHLNVPANSSVRLRLPKESRNTLWITAKNVIVRKGENLKVQVETKY